MAAVTVLEAAGYEVQLATERKCCGRPAFSQGNLGAARKLGRRKCPLKQCEHAGDDRRRSARPVLPVLGS